MNGLRWMTVEQIRKQQRMRRERVLEAMLSGELPYEQRGRIRYARVCDVEAWEQSRLTGPVGLSTFEVSPELRDFAGGKSRCLADLAQHELDGIVIVQSIR